MSDERQRLSRDRIVNAAIEIMDESGLASLSMDRLGRKLSVTDMALYKHVLSKEELLSLMLDALVSGLPPVPAGSVEETLRAFGWGLWTICRAHPQVLPLLAARPLSSPTIRAAAADAQVRLVTSGCSEAAASGALFSLAAYTLGAAGLVIGGSLEIAAELSDRAAATPSEAQGLLSAAIDWERADANFAGGLDALLSGLLSQLG
jgi:AcrR family transcriptional regulator